MPNQPLLLAGSVSSTGKTEIYIVKRIILKKLKCRFIVAEPISSTSFPVKYTNVMNNKRPITLIDIP